MIDMNLTLLENSDDVVVYADFWEDPRGILGVLESAKIAMLSVPCGDKTQNDSSLFLVKRGDPDTCYVENKDQDFSKCILVGDEDKQSWKIESIRVTLKKWNSFIECFEKNGYVSRNDAIILSI